MQEQINRIIELITPVFEEMNTHLVDIELRGHRNNQVLSIYADTEKGISLQEITEITKEIEDVLDLEDPIEGKYRLDVSSPGIDRPLKEKWQYQKNINRTLRVIYHHGENKKDITGILSAVSEKDIIIKTKKEEIPVPLSAIKKAIVKPTW